MHLFLFIFFSKPGLYWVHSQTQFPETPLLFSSGNKKKLPPASTVGVNGLISRCHDGKTRRNCLHVPSTTALRPSAIDLPFPTMATSPPKSPQDFLPARPSLQKSGKDFLKTPYHFSVTTACLPLQTACFVCNDYVVVSQEGSRYPPTTPPLSINNAPMTV